MRLLTLLAATSVLVLSACSGGAGPVADAAPTATASGTAVKLTSYVADLEQPWGMAFLPNGDLLVTEKERGLRYVRAGALDPAPLAGIPPAYTDGQAGYLGLALDPGFATNRTFYMAYSKGKKSANSTAVISATLSEDGKTVSNVTEIFYGSERASPAHYGARLQFGKDGALFVSLGEGYVLKEKSQDTSVTHGKIIRINTDGTAPADNPFAGGPDRSGIVWTYGHRNVQGLYYDAASDTLWATEHGPKGGDELNRIVKATNYGWPVISYGINYDGTIITDKTEAEGMVQPELKWVPSIAPSGLTMLTSDVYPGWKGDLFAGGMNGPEGLKLVRIDLENGAVKGKEDLFTGEHSIRDVVQGPDGHLYVATKDFDGIFRVDVVN